MNLDYLRELYEKGYFSIHEGFDNWEDALRASIEPLVKDGSIDAKYGDSIVNMVHEYGYYICIAPEICMPHAMDFESVHKTEICFMKVNKPVVFDDEENHQSRLFFALCADSGDAHLKNMQKLMELLDQEGLTEALVACETEEDFRKLLYPEEAKGNYEPKDNDYKEYCDMLTDCLKMRNRPIGLKVYRHGEQVPDKYWRPFRDANENYAMCQIMTLVKTQGRVIALTKEDHWCWKPLIGFGLVDIEKGSDAYSIALKNNGCMDLEKSAEDFDQFPKLERNDMNAILVGPLDQLDVTPDIVLLYANTNQQVRWMIGGLKYRHGIKVHSDFDYIDSCIWSTIPTLLSGEPKISIPDPGEVQRGGCPEDELILTVPEWMFKQMAVDTKKKIDDQNRRLNNPDGTVKMAAEMVPNFPRPGFYNKLYELWGLRSDGVVSWSEKDREK